RLEIAVDDVLGVRRGERARDLPAQPERLGRRQLAEPGQPPIERLALEVLHHDEGAAVGVVAEVEDLHDPGIPDPRHRARFVEEPVDDAAARTQLGQEHLDRRAPAEQLVLPQVHRTHPALAQLAKDLVVPYDDADQASSLVHRPETAGPTHSNTDHWPDLPLPRDT